MVNSEELIGSTEQLTL